MAVKLRLRRMGRKKRPIYAVVAADSRSPRDGRFIEDLGRYNPIDQPASVSLKEERILYWLEQGAQPSETVRSLLRRHGLLLAMNMKRRGKSDEEIQAAVEAHRIAREQKVEEKITASARRQKALEAERKRVADAEAKAARERAEAEAAAKREAEERKRAEAAERQRIQEAESASEPEVKKEDVVSTAEIPGGPEPTKEGEIPPETQKEEKAAATTSEQEQPESSESKSSGKPTEVSASEPEVKKEDEIPPTQKPGGPEPTQEGEIPPETQKEEKAAATKGDEDQE